MYPTATWEESPRIQRVLSMGRKGISEQGQQGQGRSGGHLRLCEKREEGKKGKKGFLGGFNVQGSAFFTFLFLLSSLRFSPFPGSRVHSLARMGNIRSDYEQAFSNPIHSSALKQSRIAKKSGLSLTLNPIARLKLPLNLDNRQTIKVEGALKRKGCRNLGERACMSDEDDTDVSSDL